MTPIYRDALITALEAVYSDRFPRLPDAERRQLAIVAVDVLVTDGAIFRAAGDA